jgi:hypothetical protein
VSSENHRNTRVILAYRIELLPQGNANANETCLLSDCRVIASNWSGLRRVLDLVVCHWKRFQDHSRAEKTKRSICDKIISLKDIHPADRP